MSPSSKKYVKFGSAIAIIVIALSYLAYTGVKETESYYVTIKELRAMGDGAYTKPARRRQCAAGYHQAIGTHADFLLVENGGTPRELQRL